MKKAMIILASLLMGTVAMAKVPEDIKKAYQVQKGEGTVVAMFKYTLKAENKDSNKVTAIMIRGFEIAYEEAKESDTIGTGVMFDDKSMEANYVTYEDFKALKEEKY